MTSTTTPAAARSRARGGSHLTLRRREALTGYGLLLPSFAGVLVFLAVPVVVIAGLSFMSWDLISPAKWAGLANYRFLFSSSDFGNSLLVTAIFTLVSIPLLLAAGLALALALNRRLPAAGALRVLYVIPWISAPLTIGLVWRWMFDPTNGALNAILGQRIEWLTSFTLALPCVIFVYVWSQAGYVSLFFLAGLQTIPEPIYEAAKLDGAGPWQMLRRITLPLLRPTTFFVLLTSVISSFQVFDTVYALTRGGPAGRTQVIASLIYNEAFVSFRMGRAAAIAVVLFVLLVGFAIVQQRYFRSRTVYDLS